MGGPMTTSAEICLTREYGDTSARANLEVLHLTWMNVVTTHPHPCLALGTSGLACVAMSTKTRLSTLPIFPVAATVRLFAKTMMAAGSSAMQWTTKATMASAGFITTVTDLLTTNARTAWCDQEESVAASVDQSSQILTTAVRDPLLLVLEQVKYPLLVVLEHENKFNVPKR